MDAVKFHTFYSAELSPTGPKFWEIIMRSWQVELSTWAVKIWNQPIRFRSDLVFDIVNYVHVIFLYGD